MMPFANTCAMQKHLMEISRAVAPGACAVMSIGLREWAFAG
jgi:hypothetical protein